MANISDIAAAVAAWTKLVASPDEAAALLLPLLAPSVTSGFPTGEADGPDAVAAGAASPRIIGAIGAATWSEPAIDGSIVRTRATAAPGAVIGGLDVAFTLGDDGLIARIEQAVVPAAPPQEQPLSLTGAIAETIDGALSKGSPVVVAYVDARGQPNLSLRGSVRVHDDQTLQVWVRKAEGGLAGALATNDRVSFWYRNGEERATIQIKGRGRVVTDPALRQAIYDSTVEPERRADAQCKGVGVLVDVDSVEGRLTNGGVRMVRPA